MGLNNAIGVHLFMLNKRDPPSSREADKSYRTTLWSIVTYPTEADLFRLGIENRIRTYAYIRHDKDILEDGTPKEPHYHVLLSLVDTKAQQQVVNWLKREVFCSGCNVLAQPIKSRASAWRYLCHLDNPEKVQYSPDEIQTNKRAYWERPETMGADKEAANAFFLHDLMTLSPVELARRYGRDYIKNFDRYHAFVRAFYDSYMNTLRNEKGDDEYTYDPAPEQRAEEDKKRAEEAMEAYLHARAERSK